MERKKRNAWQANGWRRPTTLGMGDRSLEDGGDADAEVERHARGGE